MGKGGHISRTGEYGFVTRVRLACFVAGSAPDVNARFLKRAFFRKVC
jgi:hypothetical protein